MSERDFAIQLATLAEAFGEQKLTPVRIEAYHRNLQDVPIPLLALTVDRMIQQIGSDSFRWTALPPVADIRKWAEIVRREEIPKHAIGECGACDSTRWKALDGPGNRVEKCHCLKAHAHKLAQLGLTTMALASFPAGREEPEIAEQDYPTRDQLPDGVRGALDQVRSQRVIR